MKKFIVSISMILVSISCMAQENIKENTFLDPRNSIMFVTTGPAKLTRIYIDNIDLQGVYIPSFQGIDMVKRMKRKKLTENTALVGNPKYIRGAMYHIHYTSPYIYQVDGVLLVSEKDKKKLANLDIWDTTYFEVLKPREAKKRFGKVGKKGAVIIKTAKGNYIDTK